ncbi:hypothetical protein [Nissabacter sp. SGAir0207]|uniref:hypothetical protein n=1 Tax=Nissabacter sp. SGAir0207 TaxID=2126321 RepID=UPI0010CD3375|nr:hypothetical protein [Nissabacter sp. SGAir0207]QCR38884.1 hypothetical protein C1N62_22485 [Nissabacter sp. SGAir0207]
MTDTFEQAEQKTLKFWLSAQKSAGKKNIQPKGFVIRFPNGERDLFYSAQGEWLADLTQAKSFERLEEAGALCDQLQEDPDQLPQGEINPIMADFGILPHLDVMFWGMASERANYLRVLW